MIHISRKLRLYISDVSDLSPEAILNLKRMVHYIMAIFVEFWIRVKRWPNIADAASHYLFMITRLRDLDHVTQKTVRPVVQRGGYCLHEESLLLSLLCSPDLHQRMFAVIFLDCWGLTTSIILVNGDTQNFEKVLGASGRCNFIHEIFHSLKSIHKVDIEPSHVVWLT